MAPCMFCEIVGKKRPTELLADEDGIVAFRDVNPQAPTHVLLVPARHVESVNDLTARDADLIGRMVVAARSVARREKIDETGYRLVFNTGLRAGQSIPHLHLHLLGGRTMGWPPG